MMQVPISEAHAALDRAQQRLSELLLAEDRDPQQIAEQAELVRRCELAAAEEEREGTARRRA